MDKDYEAWHQLKKAIHERTGEPLHYKAREVWWVCMRHNVGHEEDGKGENFERPVLIIKGFSKRLFWGVPLSTTPKRDRYHHQFMVNGNTVSSALISQMRTFDAARLINKLGVASSKDFDAIKSKLQRFLD